jgi:hypothetical protein
MRTPVITFDCDGVLANFTKMLTAVVNARFGTEYTQDWPDYNASNFESAHIDAGFDMVLEEPHFWGLLESYPGTPFQKIGNMLFEGVFTGYVVSRRRDPIGGNAAAQTRYWLNERGLTHLQGVIVGNQDRAVLLTLLGSDAHLDDFGDQVLELRARGVNAYLLDRSWNQDTEIDPQYRVASVDEFLERVVAQFLPAEAVKTYFSPPQITDLVSVHRPLPASETARLIRETNFQFSGLAEASQA